jgi:hypothetical protein
MRPSAQQAVTGGEIGTLAPPFRRRRAGQWWRRPLAALTDPRWSKTDIEFKERVLSWPNALTLARLVVTVALLTTAILVGSPTLLLGGLLASWLADTADGRLARTLRCETVFGAQFDAAADRVTVLLVVIGSAALSAWEPSAVALAAVVWLQYGVADQLLFAQFLRFDLWTPDEFHTVDPKVWLVTWSQIGKMASGTPTACLAIGGGLAYGGAALAIGLIALRLVCYVRIAELRRAAAAEN